MSAEELLKAISILSRKLQRETISSVHLHWVYDVLKWAST